MLPKIMKDRITSLTAILIIVFIAMLLFAGVFAYWQYENYKTPSVASPQTQGTETAGWKTYRNEKYGFEMQYPASISKGSFIDYKDPNSMAQNGIATGYDSGDSLFVADLFSWDSSNLVCARYALDVSRSTYPNIDDWVKKQYEIEKPHEYEGITIQGKVTSVENFNIGGVMGKKVLTSGGFPFVNGTVGIIKDGKLYTISYLDMSSERDRSCGNMNVQGVFNQILSTFKFTK
jgi:hypothetical protein